MEGLLATGGWRLVNYCMNPVTSNQEPGTKIETPAL